MAPRRSKLAPGIWQDQYGIAIVVRSNKHGYAERRYPHGTSLRTLKRERQTLAGELQDDRRRKRVRTTLREDVETYLKAVKALKTKAEREYHLSLWTAIFGSRHRDTIKPHEIRAQRDTWLSDGKAASTVNHYLRALSNLYRVLDPDGPNPVRQVPEASEPEAIPRAIPPAVVRAIFAAMTPSATRARLMVVATTGIEQATFAELAETDVDLQAGTVRLPKRKKGQSAHARILPLTKAGVRAFKEVEKWDAWGGYSPSSAYKSFKRACGAVERETGVPLPDLRPKDLRHTFGTELSLATDGNTATVAAFLGHASQAMADRYRSAAIPQHLKDAAAKLGRRSVGTTVGRPQKKTARP